MLAWKGFLLLACMASLVLDVASNYVRVGAAAEGTIYTVVHVPGDIADTSDNSDGSCGRPPICKKDEVYTDCKNVSCTLYSCSELGFPLKCETNCKPGCICKGPLVRADNGACVPQDQCPSCGGDPNAGPGCGSYCINCSNYKKQPVACPFSCIINGCGCKDGFYYDRNVKKCVLPSQCTPTCGANEVYSSCTNGGCEARNCSQVGKPVPCVRPKVCLQGCVCAEGYLRASNGTCVPKDQCGPPKCKANEIYDVCPAPCPPRRCNVDDRVIKCAAPPKPGDPACRPGCRCTDGYARNATGTCVLRCNCEKPLTCKANEVYDSCPGICPPQQCGVDPAVILCLPNPEYGDPRCQPSCICVDGYVRNADNVCIPKEQCPPTCGANEVYSTCTNGGCDARNCSQAGKPVPCIKLDPKSCIKGCVCVKGYLRNSDGTCVPETQCPLNCGVNEVYSTCTNGGCDPRNCTQVGQPKICIDPIRCFKGCVCAKGYLRDSNGKCVPENQCPPRCKKDEVYTDCKNVSCTTPYSCSELGFPLKCDTNCKPGCVCIGPLVRADNGACVPPEQCPSCGGDPNAGPGCGSYCINCSNYKKKPVACPLICVVNGCECKDGYYYDRNVKKCVLPSQCTPTCGNNEVYNACTNGGCDARNCTQVGRPVPCVKLDPKSCIKGCVCADGYLRDSDGTCVPKDQCPQQCGENAYFETCISGCSNQTCDDIGKIFHCPIQPAVCRTGCRCNPGFWRNKDNKCIAESQCPTPPCPDGEIYNRCPTVKCDGDYCPKTRDSPLTCPVGIVCDPPRCTCGFNRHRDRKTGKCITTSDCPPYPCNGPNEEYQSCPATCPGENCTDYINNTKCPPYKIGIVVPCQPQCRCKTGYYRNDNGVCILGAKCGTCTGQNEYFDTCIKGCSDQSCDSIGQTLYSCPAETSVCRTGCRCNPGFYRNANNVCVAESECPAPPCPNGETYNRCPTVKCDRDYCPKTRDSPQTCPVGIVCDPPRCTCGFNQKRDRKTGKCIATRDCPPFACNGPNEEYQSCPVNCPGENCTDYINDSKCPPGRIGIILQCRPQCKCKTGYYRNANGACIIGYKCGPKKGATTITPVVITTPSTPCDDGDSGGTGNTDTGIADLQAGITQFTGQFLYDRMNANKGDNIIISAFSVFTPLAQLALYADGESLNQLLAVLNMKSKDEIRTAFPALTASYEGQTNVSFANVAKVYSNIIYQLSDGFKKDSVDIFHAEGQELDFSKNTEAAAIINAWVESQTNNLIQDLVSPDVLSALTGIVLVNAIYFKGTWLYEFDKKNTNDADFYLSDGTTKQTKLMYQQATFNYGEIDELDCKVLEMRYLGNFSMFIALPNKNDGVMDLADKFRDPAVFSKAYGSMTNQKVEVYLPPFEITTTTDLSDILKQQSVTQIFDEQNSGLSGILQKPEDIYVSAAIQKAYMKTDETGSEAAAANAVVVTTRALPVPPPEPKVFRADKAFLYYIKLKSTVLFCGVFNG